MVFSSLIFTFIFLPLVVCLYYLAKEEYRNYILLIASLLFYSYGEPRFVFVMMASIVINYGLALVIDTLTRRDKKRSAFAVLWVDILVNIAILFVFKYLTFTQSVLKQIFGLETPGINIVLPIGISFFTFQALSYVVDVYRGSVPVQKNPLYVALYISFFPQLIAGPIVRYSTIEKQIAKRNCTLELFAEGCRRFFLGFSKKIILANNLAIVAEEVFGMDAKTTSPAILWIGSICYSLQIYYDFSAYSDMAIGLGKMFGFEFEENFNYPYISKSITEFWRRWHISLGQWFRDYVYIPLGGSRVGAFRHIFNLFIVWLLTGVWHGANYTFIAWGIFYFVMQILEKYIIKPEKRKNFLARGVWQIITLLCVNFAWVFFNSATISQGAQYCMGMLGGYSRTVDYDAIVRYMREFGLFIAVAIVCSTPLVKVLGQKLDSNSKLGLIKAVVAPLVYGILFLWSVSFLILGAHNPFIYFNF